MLEKRKVRFELAGLIIIEASIIFFISLLFFNMSVAQIGNNVSVKTNLSIGNSAPEIVNITLFQDLGNGIDLVANSSKELIVQAIIRDYNGDADIENSSMVFYDSLSSFYADSDDNNDHYSNFSCSLDKNYGDSTEANATCRFNIWYYANNATWNLSVYSYDNSSLLGSAVRQTRINTLLAVGVPEEINYGLVNATNVSREVGVNLSNYGNVRINLTLEGYAVNQGDNLAMNCTLGLTKNISINYEKYNLTASNTSILNLTQFESLYLNLTNSTTVKYYGLNYRQDDINNEAFNSSYWRIYVPAGVAGSCRGNIIMGATLASGS